MAPRNRPRISNHSPKGGWKVAGIVAAVALATFGGLWLAHTFFKPKPKALQVAIAKQFGGRAGAVVPNVPSRRGRYPGAVLAVSPSGSELLVHMADRPETIPAPSGSLKGVELLSKSAAWELAGRAFSSKVEGSGDATVYLDLQDIRIFEQEAGKLAAALRGDEGVNRARARGQVMAVVTKAYEAVPTITVHQQSNAKAEDWAKLKGELTRAKGQVTADDAVEFKSKLSQVVAYETSDVKFLADNFAPGGIKVELAPGRLAWAATSLPQPRDFGAIPAGQGVTFAVFASPVYSAQSFGDLPAASASAALIANVLEAAGSRPLETGLVNSQRLTASSFADARRRVIETIKAQNPKAFVFYYAGHAVSGMAGAHYLVMSDYQGNLTNDLKQSSPFVPARGPQHPLAGSNIDDIAKVIAAAGQELATSEPGLVAVADVYRELAETGVPFAIVVDGCYPADAIRELKTQLSGMFWWVGNGDAVGREQTVEGMRSDEYRRALRTYGEAPYLRSTNPIIFATLPGMFAPVTTNPLYETDLVPGVGPLAAKLCLSFAESLLSEKSLTLGEWLSGIADFKSSAQPGSEGSISWSSFGPLGNVQMVTFNTETK
jgi:hypothetical protein